MAIRKSLLTTVNNEQDPQSHILFIQNEGSGTRYTGDDPIVVNNETSKISFNDTWSGITTLKTSTALLTQSANTISSNLTYIESTVNDIPYTYVNYDTYTPYTSAIDETLTTITTNTATISSTIDSKANKNDLDNLSDLVNSKANKDILDSLSSEVQLKANKNDLDSLSSEVQTKVDIDIVNEISDSLNDVIDTVNIHTSAIEELNDDLNKTVVKYSDIEYDSTNNNVIKLNSLPLKDINAVHTIAMYDGEGYDYIELTGDENYNKIIPFASAADPIQGTTGSPGVMSIEDKTKLDKLKVLSDLLNDSANHPNAVLGMSNGIFGWIDNN